MNSILPSIEFRGAKPNPAFSARCSVQLYQSCAGELMKRQRVDLAREVEARLFVEGVAHLAYWVDRCCSDSRSDAVKPPKTSRHTLGRCTRTTRAGSDAMLRLAHES